MSTRKSLQSEEMFQVFLNIVHIMFCSLIPKDLHRVVTEYFPKVEAVNLVVQCVFHENANWSFVKQYIPAKSILMFTT